MMIQNPWLDPYSSGIYVESEVVGNRFFVEQIMLKLLTEEIIFSGFQNIFVVHYDIFCEHVKTRY